MSYQPLPHQEESLPPFDMNDLQASAKQFGEYLKFEPLAENQRELFLGEVEKVLMRVDEFGSLMDTVCRELSREVQGVEN
jgi:hypothetical protein